MSNLSHNQKSFTQLTRYGMPQFRAIRRPMEYAGESVEVGMPVTAALQATPGRLRQFYDQRRIEPIPETIPTSTGDIPAVVLEQQALQAGEVQTGVFADVVPGIEMPVDIEEVMQPVPLQRSRRNR